MDPAKISEFSHFAREMGEYAQSRTKMDNTKHKFIYLDPADKLKKPIAMDVNLSRRTQNKKLKLTETVDKIESVIKGAKLESMGITELTAVHKGLKTLAERIESRVKNSVWSEFVAALYEFVGKVPPGDQLIARINLCRQKITETLTVKTESAINAAEDNLPSVQKNMIEIGWINLKIGRQEQSKEQLQTKTMARIAAIEKDIKPPRAMKNNLDLLKALATNPRFNQAKNVCDLIVKIDPKAPTEEGVFNKPRMRAGYDAFQEVATGNRDFMTKPQFTKAKDGLLVKISELETKNNEKLEPLETELVKLKKLEELLLLKTELQKEGGVEPDLIDSEILFPGLRAEITTLGQLVQLNNVRAALTPGHSKFDTFQRKLMFGLSVGQNIGQLDLLVMARTAHQGALEVAKSGKDIKVQDLLEEGSTVTNLGYFYNQLSQEISNSSDKYYKNELVELRKDIKRSLPLALTSEGLQTAEKTTEEEISNWSKEMSTKVNTLAPNQRLLIPCGTKGHAMLMVVQKQNDGKVKTTLINTGAGLKIGGIGNFASLLVKDELPTTKTFGPHETQNLNQLFPELMEQMRTSGREGEVDNTLNKNLGIGKEGALRPIQKAGVCSFQVLTEALETTLLTKTNSEKFKTAVLARVGDEFAKVAERAEQQRPKSMFAKLHTEMLKFFKRNQEKRAKLA